MSCYMYFIWLAWLFVNMLFFVLYLVNIISAVNVIAQVNSIPMPNGTNFKVWKEVVEIVLGCMNLDLILRTERPISTMETSNEVKIEKWDRSNRMCLMIMKCYIPEAFWGSISDGQSEKKFLEEIEQYFAKNEKAETSNLLAKLISMKYKGKSNIREYFHSGSLQWGKNWEMGLFQSNVNYDHEALYSRSVLGLYF